MDKYRLSLIAIAVLAGGILVGAWFLGVQPQLDRMAKADEQKTAVAQLNATQQAKNTALKADNERLDEYTAELAQNQAQIPGTRSQQALINQINTAAAGAGVTMTSLAFDEPTTFAAPTNVELATPAGSTLVAVGVSLSATGDRRQLEQFAANIQASSRIITVLNSQYAGPQDASLILSGVTWVLMAPEMAPPAG